MENLGKSTMGRSGDKATSNRARDKPSQRKTSLDGQSQATHAPSSQFSYQTGQSAQPSHQGSKVAIPRAQPKIDHEHRGWLKSQRTNQACAACRRRKVKCGGEKPQCKQCQTSGAHCAYTEGKRDRSKRVIDHIDQIEDLLRRLVTNPEIGEKDKIMIEQILLEDEAQTDEKANQRFGGGSLPPSSRGPWSSIGSPADSKKRRMSYASPAMEELMYSSGGENYVTGAVGSAGSVDVDMEDHDRDDQTRAIGMRGKLAVSTWLQSVAHEAPGGDPRSSLPFGRSGDAPDATDDRVASSKARHVAGVEGEPPSVISYHQDSREVVKHLEDPLFMPPQPVAEQLVKSYMKTVHRAFVLLDNADSLLGAINQYYIDTCDGGYGSLPWQTQAIANLIFAIGTNYCDLTGSGIASPGMDHLEFYNRARQLSMRGVDFVGHPNMAQVKILSLTSLYFLTTGQVNRSWRFSGMAINDATSLGLHLRNQAHGTSLLFKQNRVRTWWALFNIDHIICVTAGRPSAISMKHCSVPYPAPYSQEMLCSPSGQTYLEQWDRKERTQGKESPLPQRIGLEPAYLRLKIRLTVIDHGINDNIYSANIASNSWKDVQMHIANKESELEFWMQTLPPGLRFELEDPRSLFSPENEALLWEKLSLAFSYYAAKCALYRPCVCRIDARIKSQSEQSKTFNSEKATQCVEAAKTMIALLPDYPDATWLYQNGPWWSCVEDILRPASVCLLEMAHELVHLHPRSKKEENENLMFLVEKIMFWLHEMGKSDIRAKSAHGILVGRWKILARKTNTRSRDGNDQPIPKFGPKDDGLSTESRNFDPGQYGAAADSNQSFTDGFDYSNPSQANEQSFAQYSSAGHDMGTGYDQSTDAAVPDWGISPQTMMQAQDQMQDPNTQYHAMFPFDQQAGYYSPNDLHSTHFDQFHPFQALDQDNFSMPAAILGMPAQSYTDYSDYPQDAGPTIDPQFTQGEEATFRNGNNG